jgi:hypothetical protein
MSFTDICRLDLPVPELEEMCDPLVYMDIDRAFTIINVFATAFFRRELCGDKAMGEFLEPVFASTFSEVAFESAAK